MVDPMKLMMLVELGSTGAEEMSWFQGLRRRNRHRTRRELRRKGQPRHEQRISRYYSPR